MAFTNLVSMLRLGRCVTFCFTCLLVLAIGCAKHATTGNWYNGTWSVVSDISSHVSGLSKPEIDAIKSSTVSISGNHLVFSIPRTSDKQDCILGEQQRPIKVSEYPIFNPNDPGAINLEQVGLHPDQAVVVIEVKCPTIFPREILLVKEKDTLIVSWNGVVFVYGKKKEN
jgi:hypothetical protein